MLHSLWEHGYESEILLPSAVHLEERLTVSPCARPAVSHTETHSLGFLSVADASLSSGATLHRRPSSGRMVTQPTADSWVGGSNPGSLYLAPPLPPRKVSRPGFEPPTENFVSSALPFDQRLSDGALLPHCLEPSERKLLTPPPHPPTPKSDIQF